MAIEFCHVCHKTTQCRVIDGGRFYFEAPYMNAYVRTRKCDVCSGEFKTYEIGQPSFTAMRTILDQSKKLAGVIDATWSATKREFDERKDLRGQLPESKAETQ